MGSQRTETTKRWADKRLQSLKELAGDRCSKCGAYVRDYENLKLRAITPDKRFSINRETTRRKPMRDLITELKKFRLFCPDCAHGPEVPSRPQVGLGHQKQVTLNKKLFKAVYEGDLPAVQQLIQDGADPDAKNRTGLTPLMIAMGRNHRFLIQYFVRKRAGLNLHSSRLTIENAYDRDRGVILSIYVKMLPEDGFAFVDDEDEEAYAKKHGIHAAMFTPEEQQRKKACEDLLNAYLTLAPEGMDALRQDLPAKDRVRDKLWFRGTSLLYYARTQGFAATDVELYNAAKALGFTNVRVRVDGVVTRLFGRTLPREAEG